MPAPTSDVPRPRRWLDRRRTSGPPVIVTGDFNARDRGARDAGAGGGFDDAFSATGVAAGDPRRASCGPHRIDHLLTRGLRATACAVYREAGDASDHLPVVATFEVAASSD